MNPSKLKYEPSWVGLRPELLGAMLEEAGSFELEKMAIHPADGVPGALLREILDVRYEKRPEQLTIRQKSKSEYRAQLEELAPPGHPIRELLQVFEAETAQFRILLALRERRHVLGLSPLQPGFFELPPFLDEEQERIMAYYLPYAPQIRGDMLLTRKCLFTALGQPVAVSLIQPKTVKHIGGTLGRITMDSGASIGGQSPGTRPCVAATIGPVPPEKLQEYVPGGRQRRFLEDALLPALLPEGWDWTTAIIMAENYNGFRLSEEGYPLHIDINAIVE